MADSPKKQKRRTSRPAICNVDSRRFTKKHYNADEDVFVTRESLGYERGHKEKKFKNFTRFYNYLKGDLEGANLYSCDFKGINLHKFNIEGAHISANVLIEQSLYDDTFYNANIRDFGRQSELMHSAGNETEGAVAVPHEYNLVSASKLNDDVRKIYYVSDIHINHKLLRKFPLHATRLEVLQYIREIVKTMVSTATDRLCEDYLLIAGDVSFNIEVSSLFYAELAKEWPPYKIVVVLGNHELWNFEQDGSSSDSANGLAGIITCYRKLFGNLGIRFLQNDLMILTRASHESHSTKYTGEQVKIISEEQLLCVEPGELKATCLRSSLAILGGLGFSGLNPEMNATNGIYRETIASLAEDVEQTKRFERIYKTVNNEIGGEPVIVLTHTPKENWTDEFYNCNWMYVNGHTHRNFYFGDEEKTVYSDNQIGYHSQSIGLKHFHTSKYYDIFRYYEDGIYPITREQYVDFNRGAGIEMTFNRVGQVYMVKRNNVYCFFFVNRKTGKLYLLNGGMINSLKHQAINYYFEKMEYYSNAIKKLFAGYHQALKSISNCVKAIGGDGAIHGCIVDIDFLNHIYVNPTDGTITPYFALSIVDKYQYHSVEALLLQQRKDLYSNYMKISDRENHGIKLLKGDMSAISAESMRFVKETDMYRPSRVIRSLQYLTDTNVIRMWNDQLIEALQVAGTGSVATKDDSRTGHLPE